MTREGGNLVKPDSGTIGQTHGPKPRKARPFPSRFAPDRAHSGGTGHVEQDHQQVGKGTDLTIEPRRHGAKGRGGHTLRIGRALHVANLANVEPERVGGHAKGVAQIGPMVDAASENEADTENGPSISFASPL